MRAPSALLPILGAQVLCGVVLCIPAAQARPATFVLVHAAGMAAMPPAPVPTAAPTGARARYLPLIAREATGTGLPVAVADAVAQIESGYDPTVVGSVGEIGLMQVRPATAAMLGFRGTEAELAAPEINVRYGVRYLAEAWRRAEGDLCRALMKYRAGHGSEAMSPLSQLYCARAQAILGGTAIPAAARETARGEGQARGPAVRWAAAHPKGRAPASETEEPVPREPQSFWAAHRARVARINAKVLAAWRARGWNRG